MKMTRTKRDKLILAAAAALSVALYLAASARTTGAGFPLDDAWIHQTYARSLARGQGWSFYPGQPSAGLTAPLWALLLAPGHWLDLGPYLLTILLGWAALYGLSLLARRVMQAVIPDRPGWGLAAGLLICLEWHLVWASVSGMETLLFALLVTLILTWPIVSPALNRRAWFIIGALVGLSAWLRPEGITLLAPLLLVWVCGKRRWRSAAALLAGYALAFLPYLAFNRWLAGAWWPNTFYAKQAEYAILRQQPLISRLLGEFSLTLIGAGALLLPGLLYQVWRVVKAKSWPQMAALLWLLGFLALYALRLPVTYQHGRYAMPAMPILFFLGIAGVAALARPSDSSLWPRLLSRAWLAALALVTALFWGLGAQAYARDVAVINTEMVATARWLADNSAPDDLIAAHDIGALGYFAQRPLLDLAGLISPDVIPFIRDEARLAEYMDQRQPRYLVTFPAWYPQLTKDKNLQFSTNGAYSPALGGENMAVFSWDSP